MTRKNRILSLLLVVSVLVSMLGILWTSAAAPEALDVSTLSASAGDVVSTLESSITAAQQDIDGVYYAVAYPSSLTVGSYTVPTEDFILMAANALRALSEGKAASTQIAYKDVSIDGKAVKNGTGTSLNKAQYLELAERVSKYGNTTSKLATSYNRPTDGTAVYEGRVSIYTIGYIFAKALAAYKTAGQLPATVEFLPVHYGEVEVTPTEKPAEPEDWYAAVIEAAVQVKASMDKNVIPGTIYVGNIAVTPAQFQYLACQVVVGLDSGITSGDLSVPTIGEAENPTGSATGQVPRADYVAMAKKIIAWDESHPEAPNCSTSSTIGVMHYYDVIHMYAKILNFYKTEGMLPNYNTSVGWSGTVEEVATPTEPTTKPTTAPTTASTAPDSESSSASSSSEPVDNGWYGNVISGATYLVNYVKEKGLMPDTIPVGTYNLTPAQFLYLETQVLVNISKGITSGELSVPTMAEPSNPAETVTSGTLQISEVLTMAGKIVPFMDSNGCGPNWMTSSLGTVHYYTGIHMYAYCLKYYAENGTLPASVQIGTWFTTSGGVAGDATFGYDYSGYEAYLVPTANCQSNNATIIAVAKQAMNCPSSQSYNYVYDNPKTTWEAMWNLTEFTTYVLTYDYYANTSRGALGVWRDKAGNCCDMAHFTIAMARSLGVPGRYSHWECQFSSSREGHVWASLYIPHAPDPNINNENGWIYSDPVNNNCKLGYQSFRLIQPFSANQKIELPF